MTSIMRSSQQQQEGQLRKVEAEEEARRRFLLELEFVQCLANPTYIHYLAQNRYFDDEAFVNYLKYLLYFQEPEYAKFIVYPHTLYFLLQLQNPNFRRAMAHPENKEVAHRQQFYFWKHYRSNRLKYVQPRPFPEEPPAPPAQPAPSALPAPASSKVEPTPRSAVGERRKRKPTG